MLNFQKNHHHLSLVTMPIQTGTETDSKAERETCGIITLEDIIEEIICDEIVDETDVITDMVGASPYRSATSVVGSLCHASTQYTIKCHTHYTA